ncbi:MAG: TAT-variant-translocated molybdopterin oxidoreductase [Acidobacteriota bacterium]
MGELVQLRRIAKPSFEDGGQAPLDPQSSIPDPRTPNPDPQSSTLDPRSSILNPQSSILNPPSSILDPQPASRIAAISARLEAKRGKHYWRSLEELADSEEFQEVLHREFPENATEWNDPAGRRKFLKLMGASLALAGFAACTRQPAEQILPYVRQPEEIVPGRPLFFATAMPLAGYAIGLLAESHEGRPTKIEGNKDHPASLGATDVYSQASVLGLYDPDRSQSLTNLGEISTWSAFLGAIRPQVEAQRALASQPSPASQPLAGGGGLRILTETVTSPTLEYQIKTLLATIPTAKWHQYDPAGRDNVREGAKLAFGQYANTVYHFDKADVVLSLDSDFLASGPGSVRYARDFANKRRLSEEKHEMNRLYVVESCVTSTGSIADHRLPVRASEVEGVAREIFGKLGTGQPGASNKPEGEKWAEAIANDLDKHRGSSIVVAGDSQPANVHSIAHVMNGALGNIGKTVIYTDPVEANPVDGNSSLRELANDMEAGKVDLLLIVGGNPVYDAHADLDFGERIRKVKLRIHLSLYNDETSELCQWHVPEAHYLESWSDARAFDGTVSIIQPLIAPLYSGKTAHEVLAAFMNEPERASYDIVRDYWMKRYAAGGQPPPIKAQAATAQKTASGSGSSAQPATSGQAPQSATGGFEAFWRKSLHDGVVGKTAAPIKPFAPTGILNSRSAFSTPLPDLTQFTQPPPSKPGLEIVFRADPTVFDGRFANNGWLQELPKPLSKLTWDNAAIISPATASRLGVGKDVNGLATNKIGNIGGDIIADEVELEYQGRKVRAPVYILPGQPDDSVTVHLGYGRTKAGRVGNDAGFNAYAIRTSDAPWFGSGLQITKTGTTYTLAATQIHHAIDTEDLKARDIVRSGSLAELKKNPTLAPEHTREEHGAGSLFPKWEYKDYAWGMSIDMSSCIGCSACVVACQAENNIPVVGKEQVARSREMHWLRIDSYYKGSENNPETYFQPVLCQQCEDAPCELVCPVAATVHSSEGLNDMVYNRCVGTRYCSNNCPYKVRRFNFLLYQDFYTASLKMMRNPDVSVRSRGVMEKCTYCVQRIQKAKIESQKEDRQVRDGEIATACEAACPTQAIVFGNINDPASRVSKLKKEERNYSLLGELNTKPRTTYLGVVRNPNPELEHA